MGTISSSSGRPSAVVKQLATADGLPDEEEMVPIDMRGAGDDLELDVEEMVQNLGPQKAAEAFVKCQEYFAANKDQEDEEDRPQPMTCKEWRTAGEGGEGEESEEALGASEDEGEEDCEE